MKQMLKRLLLAGEHNNHHPHILRETAALGVIAIFILILVGISGIPQLFLSKNGMLGEVYPAVVATLTNQGREAQALSDLKRNSTLDAAARNKAHDMVVRGYFAHKSPDGRQPWDWIREAGYQYEYAGENLAINYNDSIDVYTAWMNSPTHKANILNSHYTEIGIGIATTTIEGKESVLVVQMFGSPKYPSRTTINEPITRDISTTSNPIASVISTNTTGSSTGILGASIEVEGDNIYENDPYAGSNSSTDINAGINTGTNDGSSISLNSINSSEDSGMDSHVDSQNVKDINFASVLGVITTNSRHISLIIYGIFILLLNISVISLGNAEYKKGHKKALFIALLLLCLISLLSYVYVYMKAAEVILI